MPYALLLEWAHWALTGDLLGHLDSSHIEAVTCPASAPGTPHPARWQPWVSTIFMCPAPGTLASHPERV